MKAANDSMIVTAWRHGAVFAVIGVVALLTWSVYGQRPKTDDDRPPAPGGTISPERDAAPPTESPSPASPVQPVAAVRHVLMLERVGWNDLVQHVGRTAAGKSLADDGSDQQTGRMVVAGEREQVRFEFNRQTGRLVIRGPASKAGEWARLAQLIDQSPPGPNASTRVVPLDRADRRKVRLAVQTVQAGAQAEQPPAGDDAAAGDDVLAGGEAGPAADTGLIGPVQVEFLEGLDVIVLRGSTRDVERVVRIIEDIERLSAQTIPEVRVRMLKHVGSQAMADLLIPLYDQVIQPRQGRVSITPLIKPNALLLVGRPESVQAVDELIEKIDQPVPPATEFRVFRLREAPALEVDRLIEEFYEERGGLGPTIRVLADFRSNSIIVQAGPRDIVEIGALIKKLDVASSATVNEVRIFALKNSLAEELADVLREAIQGAAGSSTGQPGQPGILGQGGGTGQNQTGQQARASMLTMTTLDAEQKEVLESGILTEVRIAADARANAIVVTGPPENMPLIGELIRQLDELETAEAQIKVFTIVNGDVVNLVEMLENLFGQATIGQGQAPVQVAAGGDSALVPLRFSVDERTNSIIASGSQADLLVVEAILLRLDESDVRQRQNEVVRLNNSPAADVALAVNEFLRSQRDVEQIAPEGLSPFEQIEREVIVVPEPVTNSLIVSATPRYFEDIMELVRDLDQRPPMVLIQVLIAEVKLDDNAEFGVELGLQDNLLFDRGVLTDVVTPGFNFPGQPLGNSSDAASLATRRSIGAQGISNFLVQRASADLNYGGLVLSASSDELSVLLRALQDDRRMDILSRPQVMTLDNQPAFVQVGQRVPRITSSQLTATGTINNTVLENVGLLLGVTPRISPEGLVVMEIDAEKSQLGPIDTGIPISINQNGDVIRSPIIDITTAQTTVSARSGQTVVLGGLITRSTSTISRRVPFLGDLPIIGHAFRFDKSSDQRTELLIIMTPYVVRDESDVENVKQIESQRMSWCLADVAAVHGDVGVAAGPFQRRDCWDCYQMPVIYPDLDPTLEGEYGPPLGDGEYVVPETEPYAAPDPAQEPGQLPGTVPQPTPAPQTDLPELPGPGDPTPVLPPQSQSRARFISAEPNTSQFPVSVLR